MKGTSRESVLQTSLLNNCMRLPHSYCMIVTLIKLIVHLIIEPHSNQRKDPLPIIGPGEVKSDSVYCSLCLVPIDLFEEVTKSQASGWVVEAEDYKMPPVPMHFYRLVTLDSFFGHCCFLIIFRSVCLQLIGFSEWELLDKYM